MKFKKYKFALIAGGVSSKALSLFSDFCYRSRSNFYWRLAALVSVGILLTSFSGMGLFGTEQNTFDTLIKMRWSSPAPSKNIVILDIDEKSLSKLAPKLGRWPWKREVMAEVLSELEGSGAKSVIFNILITDPDLGNEQSDAILNDIAAESKVVVFPLVRLPKENDSKSSLHISSVGGASLKSKNDDPTIAAILPAFPGMRKSMGISNLDNDPDGILRQYAINRLEDKWSMASLVGRALEISKLTSSVPSDSPFTINWRNKKGNYQRVSIVDYMDSLDGKGNIAPNFFAGKNVILGASAPGISNLKATSASSLTDDNEILATALDDAINNTNLKSLPSWTVALLAITFVMLLALMFSSGKASDETDILFAAIEIASIVIMFLAISYSNQFIDISPVATYGLIFFTIAKIHHGFAQKVIKGSPNHLNLLKIQKPKLLAVLAFEKDKFEQATMKKIYDGFVKVFGNQSVFLCFDVFEGDTILSSLKDVGCLAIIDAIDNEEIFKDRITTSLTKQKQPFDFEIYQMPNYLENDDKMLEFISQKILVEVQKKVA